MSQLPRFSRARQLTASVWSGKAPDDYGRLVAARLRKLAEAGSTGTLPFSGAGDGAIHFRDGSVVLARSTRTPSPAGGGADDAGAAGTPFTRLTAALAVAEPTVDATVELLSSEARFAKFRSAKAPAGAGGPGIEVEDLLAEVTRRQRVLQQLAPVVTADTVVARNPHLNAPGIGVLAPQWALLIRIRDGSTPRALAWELNRSVFGTTLEVYRLLALRLLSAAGHRPRPGGQEPRFGPATMSYVRAVTAGNGAVTPAAVPAPISEAGVIGTGVLGSGD